MDGAHFDTVVRTLVARRLTRVQTLRGLVVGVGAALSGLRLVAEEAEGKKRRKKKPVCTCSAAGCTQLKVKKPSKVINQDPRCNYAGACTTNPCAAPAPPSFDCTTDGCVGNSAGLVCNTATGQCEPCTSYTQCGSTDQLGHLACIAGRCRGGEACTSNAQCFVPLVCSQAEGNICVIGNQCDAINPCDDNPIYSICVDRLCTNECIAGGGPCPIPAWTCQAGLCLPPVL